MADPVDSSSAVGLSALVATHLGDALRAAAIGRWGWAQADGRMVWFFPEMAHRGIDPEFAEGAVDAFVATALPDERRDLRMALGVANAAGAEIHHTFRHRHHDGSVGRVHLDAAPVEDASGITVFVGVIRDDTAQMVLDQRLAETHADRDRVARVLETSLLPPPLPAVPGFTVDADYRSSEGAATGDFYDLFPLAGEDWGLTIGDVGGHGIDAAALTTVIRFTLLAAAQVRKSPARVMASANAAHFAAVRDERFTTAHYIRLHGRAHDVQMRVATAGHPELLVRRPTGRIDVVTGRGPMLGMMRSPDFVEARATLDSGDVVLAYTDGVIEARRDGVMFGRDRLESFLRSWTGPVSGCAAALHEAAAAFSGGPPRDDMATVVLRRE